LHSTAEAEDQVESRFLLDITAEASNMFDTDNEMV
jgi:hypothetical protein